MNNNQSVNVIAEERHGGTSYDFYLQGEHVGYYSSAQRILHQTVLNIEDSHDGSSVEYVNPTTGEILAIRIRRTNSIIALDMSNPLTRLAVEFDNALTRRS